jgi:hypothetical protein
LAGLVGTPYQVLLLGEKNDDQHNLRLLLEARLVDMGLEPTEIAFFDESSVGNRDPLAPTMAVFFGSPAHTTDTALIGTLIDESMVVAPLVSELTQATQELPPQLAHINAIPRGRDSSGLPRLASVVLEVFRLLRRERRLFISYRRQDSRPLAETLYDAFDARGFDVFIDIRSVPPAIDFQSVLWHRMSDSDVVVLIDTPTFRESRWTVAELARANATNVKILHLLWPGQPEDAGSALSHFLKLKWSDFWTGLPFRGRWAKGELIRRICNEAETLRAEAIAWRYRYLIDSFCDTARDFGLEVAVQPDRWILLTTPDGRTIAAVPAVGVPTADRLNEIFDAISGRELADAWVIYDSRGVLSGWLAHLDWLDAHLPIKTVQMSRVPQRLQDLMS